MVKVTAQSASSKSLMGHGLAKSSLRVNLIWALVTAVVLVGVQACGRAKAGAAPSAIEVIGPPGFTCFAIMSGDQAVGGNCVKE